MMTIGLVTGFTIYTVNMIVMVLMLRKTRDMPAMRATIYIVTRFYIRYTLLIVILALVLWFLGSKFTLGVLGGMLIGMLIGKVILAFLIYRKKELFVQLFKGDDMGLNKINSKIHHGRGEEIDFWSFV